MEEYLVIARKYRPQQFNELIGQEHVVTTLTNAIETNRVAHAYIFSGPRGIGKTTVARILAKALNCQNGPTKTPCDKCTPCQEITRGMSMDVMEIDGASNRGIDEIRELRENVRFAAAGSRFKIYIIDEVHMLTQEAFNALLKTLEEPPRHVKFFFATTAIEKVPATILSRCQRFELKRIPNALITKRLQYIAGHEDIKISLESMHIVARCAGGSLRDAESTLDKLIAYCGTNISHEDTLSILGVVDQDVLFKASSAVASSNINDIFNIITQVFEQGKDLGQFLLDLIHHFRNILLAKYRGDAIKFIDLLQDEIARIIEASRNFSPSQLLEIINILIQLQGEIRWASSKQILLEVGMIKIARTKQKISIDQLVDRLQELEGKLCLDAVKDVHKIDNNGPVRKEKPVVTDEKLPVESSGMLSGGMKHSWDEVLTSLGKRNPLLKSYLSSGTPLEFKENVLIVGFDSSCSLHQESLNKPYNKELIEQRFQEKLGRPVKIQFRILDSLHPESRKEEIADNPLVEKVRQKFGAKIVGRT